MASQVSENDAVAVRQQVERILASRVFASAMRSRRLLRYLAEAALDDPPRAAKEYVLATEVFDRGASYDPAVDSTVRVEAGRLRTRLREYYYDEGKHDELLIEVPRGAYRVMVTMRAAPQTGAVGAESDALAWSDERRNESGNAFPAEKSDCKATPGVRRIEAGVPPVARRFKMPLAVLLLILTLCVGYWLWSEWVGRHTERSIHTMAVLPLRNLSGDPAQDFFADGTTDELTTELARVPGLLVVSWNSALQEKGSSKSPHTIAQELRADALVEGSVTRSGNDIRINVQLVDARTDKHLWADSFKGRADELLKLEDTAAEEIAAQAKLVAAFDTGPDSESRPVEPINPDAREAYLRGRNDFDKRDGLASAREFQRAIDLSPRYAPAYAGLATALETEAVMGQARPDAILPRALGAAETALQIDPENGDALIARGSLELTFRWDWAAAQRDLLRGVRLRNNNSFGQMMLSVYLDCMGKPDEAVEHMRTAVAIDPLSFFMGRHYGTALYYARRYDEALLQLHYVRRLYPASAPVVDNWISAVYEKKSMYREAVQYDLFNLERADPHADTQKLLAIFAQKGWQAYWSARLGQMSGETNVDPCKGYFVGVMQLKVGDKDEALASLAQATKQHCYWTALMRVDPLLDSVRQDRRFEMLESELHLPTFE